jgi:hypothetical protein
MSDLERRFMWLLEVQHLLGRKVTYDEKQQAQRWYNYGVPADEFVAWLLKKKK